jgi:hypothetical protein
LTKKRKEKRNIILTRNFLFSCGFSCRFGPKIRRKYVSCGISCGFCFPAKTFVGNCFLRFLKSAGNFPAEFPAENNNEAVANVPANNPQVIPQETLFRRLNRMKFHRKHISAGNST